jgi:hypothetical protein
MHSLSENQRRHTVTCSSQNRRLQRLTGRSSRGGGRRGYPSG